MTSLELGILKRFDDAETRVVWVDEYVNVGQRAIKRLANRGLVEKVYSPLGRVGVRPTPSGRLARARYGRR